MFEEIARKPPAPPKNRYDLVSDRLADLKVLVIQQRRAISDAEIDLRKKKEGLTKAQVALDALIAKFNERKGESVIDMFAWKMVRDNCHTAKANLVAVRKTIEHGVREAKKAGVVLEKLVGEQRMLDAQLNKQTTLLTLPVPKKKKPTRK